METARLLIRHMKEADEQAFIRGIADQALRTAYGFPAEMDDAVPPQIFRHFCGLRNAFALVEKNRGEMTGFLLDTAGGGSFRAAGERAYTGFRDISGLSEERIYGGGYACLYPVSVQQHRHRLHPLRSFYGECAKP